MTPDMWAGIIRTLLATGGGILVAKGLVDDGTMQAVVGAVVTIVTAVWSVLSKKK